MSLAGKEVLLKTVTQAIPCVFLIPKSLCDDDEFILVGVEVAAIRKEYAGLLGKNSVFGRKMEA